MTIPRRVPLLIGLLLAAAAAAIGWNFAAAEGPTDSVSIDAAIRLDVDISERRLRVIKGDETSHSYPIAVGKNGHETPKGTFRIRRIVWNPSWVPPDSEWAKDKERTGPGDPKNPMGRVKVFFAEPAYYIHGTLDEASLGRAASHGCIRMRNEDAIELAKLVMQNGGEQRSPGWFRNILNKATRTQEVRLSSPVHVTIHS